MYLINKNYSLKSASTSIGGKVNFALMMSCGTFDLLQSWCDILITNDLSICAHMKGGSPRAQTTDAYMREGVTNESKSHPLVRGSWKYALWYCLSKSDQDAYPLASLSLTICVIENLPKRALKVTPRYSYDPTTSIGLWESVRWHFFLTRENLWKMRTLVFLRFTTNPVCVQKSSKALRCLCRSC